MSTIGGNTGISRPDFGSMDANEGAEVAGALEAMPTSSDRLLATDGASATKSLARSLVRDGRFDVADARRLIAECSDKGQITSRERGVFVSLIREHGAKITPAALEMVAQHFGVQVGRPVITPPAPPIPPAPVEPPPAPTPSGPVYVDHGSMKLLDSQRDGLVGIAKPGDTIEAINLSTAPAGRLHLGDTTVIGTADASGAFKGRLPDMQEGDVIRMRTRSAGGEPGEWVTVHVKGMGARDARNAEVNLERIDLVAGGDGSIEAKHNTARPLTEPGAKLRFTNNRTGERVDVTATDTGSIPAGLKLAGKAGDTFSIAVSDGVNNADLRTVAGQLRVPGGASGAGGVDLEDPVALKDDIRADGTTFAKVRFTGPLFIDGPTPGDVRQGAIGNCYFPAAMAAVAEKYPDVIRDMIKDNGDGTFTVRFYQNGQKNRPVDIKVDADLYARSFGGPVYGSSLGGSTQPEKMELWFPLVEKAYAQWKGGYEAIGNGGVSGKVMSEVLGRDYDYTGLGYADANRVYASIKSAMEDGRPMTAGTYGKDQAERYTNSGVYANHAYSVFGVEEENGTKYVRIRNPWGQSEPGWDGKNDGFFRLELDKFMKLYQSLSVIE